MVTPITRFLDWYERHMAKSLIISAIILYAQIPHSWWALECVFGGGYLHNHGMIVDFFLYGIDLIEIPALINVTILFIMQLRKKNV